MSVTTLFQPFQLKSLTLKNRFVMAPMTRSFSPGGVPTPDVAVYYQRRAQGEVGLILSEGTVIDRVASSNDPNIPRFHGAEALQGWKKVIEAVCEVGGRMAPQIWHMGVNDPHASGWLPTEPFEGPSGRLRGQGSPGQAMSEADIAATIQAYAQSAAAAKDLGFHAVELHGAHGYLIDQFFWDVTNQRTDIYGGQTLPERSRFAIDVVKAVRQAVGPDFPVLLRLSQWKPGAFDFKLAKTPQEMEAWLVPLADAGVDVFHCSQRRFWEAEFPESDLNFAGWAKKLTGKITITVGSVGLSGEFIKAFRGESSSPEPIDELVRRFDRGDFDLVAVGRALLSDPHWVRKIKEGRLEELAGFQSADLRQLQ
ncbi:MAG TPA: NADH:flavin oxidoreductase [Oligoflexus sp.]|uniref:NADH:flavin oxidoreductase n=1 Tax=Oligoflexus sp. TaxID=1971216 RepID=UPI002D467AAF|nr:NADH:flavin oxidoreductase [Oligoflexus sp.]HYX34615.1 NADH:flavin oxidoreductase [Oligoflexus sp.]